MTTDAARKTLGAIRILNGAVGLFAPELLLRRLGVDPPSPHAAGYPFRMFGIRTLVIGVDLWTLQGEELRRATKTAVLIHAADTVSAAVTAVRGDLPRKQALVATGISAVNTALALAANRR